MEHDIELEDIGWKALQQRRIHLEKLLRQAIHAAHERDGEVQLLDLALGSGRQVLGVLRSLPALNIHAELRDVDADNLEKGRQLANQLGVTSPTFALKDAFDHRNLQFDPSPNVVLAAGIFEMTPDNHKVLSTLSGLSQGMRSGGMLVYTDQPQHPSLEMIGRTVAHRENSPWAMRRRPSEEMDALIVEGGFEPIENLSDEHGLFRVGLARVRAKGS